MLKLLLMVFLTGVSIFVVFSIVATLVGWFAVKALFIVMAVVGALIGHAVSDSAWAPLIGAVLFTGGCTLLTLALDDGR